MMLNLYVQQNQWIVITLLCGGALMLVFCLTYASMWRPKEEETKSHTLEVKGPTSLLKSVISVVPWVLILVALASASFTVATLLSKSCMPPNW